MEMLLFNIKKRFLVLLIPLRISSPVYCSVIVVVGGFHGKQMAAEEKWKSSKPAKQR